VTVAAVILAASQAAALAAVEGQARVRRIADAAWSGGAISIIVVAEDPDGLVAAALAGASVTLAEPAPAEQGPAAQIARGMEVASDEVRGTDAALVWPAGMVWVGPETVTSLIEAHGVDRGSILRPAFEGEPGWPVLVPLAHLAAIRSAAADQAPDELLAAVVATNRSRLVELGDPGVLHGAETARSDLPPYVGPPEPAAVHTHEWGAALADEAEDVPLEGPSLAPYGQAADEG
jgi:molybdenum cofactor cytidylyltransferase